MELFKISINDDDNCYEIESLKTHEIQWIISRCPMNEAIARVVRRIADPMRSMQLILENIVWVGIEGKYDYYVYTY